MKFNILIILFLALAVSCVSHESFIRSMNSHVGRYVWHVPGPKPLKIIQINNDKSEYYYEYKDVGCKWLYVVDDRTQTIISWQFISSPDLCYVKTGFYN